MERAASPIQSSSAAPMNQGSQPQRRSRRSKTKTAAMVNSTVNDFDADNALMEEFYQMLVELGLYEAPQEKDDKLADFFTDVMKKGNDVTYSLFGAKGYLDFDPVC